MPIYEFYSPETNKIYSFFARSLSQGKLIPRCPDRAKASMERMISRFAVTGRARDKEEVAAGEDGNEARLGQAMAEMETEISSMNEENVDPRQLGSLMRKMTEASGKKMPAEMAEMIRRLEKGESPEKLEEEYGETFENFRAEDFASDGGREKKRHLRRPAPTRDPNLYEMGDYL
ncbi:zinc ribbon domain-containing protein [soil metagenome]